MAVVARISLLLLLITSFLFPKYLINEYLISPKAAKVIESISNELYKKSSINLYTIATVKKVGEGVNLFDYIKNNYKDLKEPYIVFFFAPNSKRIGIIPSNKELRELYSPSMVKDYAISILAYNDKNSLQSKYDVAVVQAVSELADEIASKKGIKLKNTIKEEGRWIIKLITYIVYFGSIIVIWIFILRPLLNRIRNGK